jgi:hydrogenase expression/formation protein HypC
MCLAVPGKVIECSGDDAVVDMQGNTLRVSKILTPEAAAGDWVLVHAGFTIAQLDEAEALQTWDYLRQVLGDGTTEAGPEADVGRAGEHAV